MNLFGTPKPKVRPVLLDGSFVHALLATDALEHGRAVALYAQLVDRYQAERDRLFALSTVLGTVPREFRRSALAPVTTLYVARQHRTAAAKIVGAPSAEVAMSLVMMRRERIHTIATMLPDFDVVDVAVIGRSDSDLGSTAVSSPAGALPDLSAVSSRTAPTPVLRSTDG